ncbi:hypothetical protein QOL99_00815 [Deinococcus sp. MIMF12]|uniref:Uncharacterized protein n=1 Tax=Deinococcus rhizophilus TaxID=3049544 RepID=A0ABT7JCC8_9DEIO|nr:hypothetical protein [Deinococcus rhizophilus]MDL2342685.1 hypothetical protein [Deinococcus rhizophilus]
MADPDLREPDLRELVPPEAAAAFQDGDEYLALTRLRRAQATEETGSLRWALLERLCGLVLIHLLREVEGTFALERADPVLDAAGIPRPGLEWLEDEDSREGRAVP